MADGAAPSDGVLKGNPAVPVPNGRCVFDVKGRRTRNCRSTGHGPGLTSHGRPCGCATGTGMAVARGLLGRGRERPGCFDAQCGHREGLGCAHPGHPPPRVAPGPSVLGRKAVEPGGAGEHVRDARTETDIARGCSLRPARARRRCWTTRWAGGSRESRIPIKATPSSPACRLRTGCRVRAWRSRWTAEAASIAKARRGVVTTIRRTAPHGAEPAQRRLRPQPLQRTPVPFVFPSEASPDGNTKVVFEIVAEGSSAVAARPMRWPPRTRSWPSSSAGPGRVTPRTTRALLGWEGGSNPGWRDGRSPVPEAGGPAPQQWPRRSRRRRSQRRLTREVDGLDRRRSLVGGRTSGD